MTIVEKLTPSVRRFKCKVKKMKKIVLISIFFALILVTIFTLSSFYSPDRQTKSSNESINQTRTPRPMDMFDKAVVFTNKSPQSLPFMFEVNFSLSDRFDEKFFSYEKYGAKPAFVLSEGKTAKLVITVYSLVDYPIEVCFKDFFFHAIQNLQYTGAEENAKIEYKSRCFQLDPKESKNVELFVKAMKRNETRMITIWLEGLEWKIVRACVLEVR